MSPSSAEPRNTDDFMAWLAAQPDEQLVRLCQLRPDVAAPPPATIEILASRLRSPASTARACDSLDTPTLLVLATVVDMGADSRPVTSGAVARRLAVKVSDPQLGAALETLLTHALVWGSAKQLRVSGAAASEARRAPVIAPQDDDLSDSATDKAWSALSDRARGMLEAIAAGPIPTGDLGDNPSELVGQAVAELCEAGLARVDQRTVTPTARALYLARSGPRPRGVSLLDTPSWPAHASSQASVDETAGVAALELLHQIEALMSSISTTPLARLKSGGVGVRELGRLARATGLPQSQLPLLLEVLAAAGLLACGDVEVGDAGFDDVWAPTDAYDGWASRDPARRWAELLVAWWSMPWRPWKVGSELVGGGTVPALADPPGPPGARIERRRAIGALAVLDPRSAADPAAEKEIVRWRWPCWVARHGAEPGLACLAEARQLGLVVGASATSAARLLGSLDEQHRTGTVASDEQDLAPELAAVLEKALPSPVTDLIVQADLTILAPGPLEPALGSEVALIADVESVGAATTYRITEQSLRRALDAGRTADSIRDLLTRTSITPLPQSLGFLIDDVSRRHGQLRVGSAQSFVRCDDEATLVQVVSSEAADRCALRRIAPTVLISQARPLDLLDALRLDGFAPIVEDTSGAVVMLHRTQARLPAPSVRAMRSTPLRAVTETDLRTAIDAMRSAQRAQAASNRGGTRRTGETAIAYLHDSVDRRRPLAVSIVDSAGRASTRLIVPTTVAGGRVDGTDPVTHQPVTLPLHRVIAVTDADSV